MKAVFTFEQGSRRQKMVLDDLTLYVPTGGMQYDCVVFDDEKDAAKAFNKILIGRYSPRHGWQIVDKKMGEAEPVAAERLVGYEPPEEEKLRRFGIYKSPGRLMLKIDRDKSEEDIRELFDTHLDESVTALAIYPDRILSAETALAVYAANPSANVKTLIVDAYDQTTTRQALIGAGDLTPIIALPGLERLYVVGDWMFIGPAESATLTHLSLLKNPMWSEDFESLVTATLPKMTTLDVGISTEEALDEESQTAFAAFCASGVPRGGALNLSGAVDLAATLDLMGDTGASFQSLYADLSVAESEPVADAIVKHADVYGKMMAMGLPLGELDDEDVERIRTVVPQLIDTDDGPHLFSPKRYALDAFLGKAEDDDDNA